MTTFDIIVLALVILLTLADIVGIYVIVTDKRFRLKVIKLILKDNDVED